MSSTAHRVTVALQKSASAALLMVLAADVGIADGPAGPFGFSGNSGNDSLTVFDLETGTAVGPDIDLLPEGDYPYDVTIHPAGQEVWICGAIGDGIIVVDSETHAILERIDLLAFAEYPVDIAFNGDGSVAYVAGRDSDAVAVVDTATYTVTDTIPITPSLGAGKMAFSTQRDELYVVSWFGDELFIIDAATQMVTELPVGDSLWDVVLAHNQASLFLADRGMDEVHVFDLNSRSVTSSIPVGDDPWGLDLTPNGAQLVVANEDDSTVSVIDVATGGVTSVTLPTGAEPRDVGISLDGAVAYIPSGDLSAPEDAVYVIDLADPSVVDAVMMNDVEPNSLAVNPDGPSSTIFADGFESGDTSAWAQG